MTQAVTDPQQYFYLHEGGALTSLDELAQALPQMRPEVFAHHVNEQKHDFSAWVRGVMGERELARSMARARTKEQLARAIFIHRFR